MLNFKSKLEKFYGKSFHKVSNLGGYFVIATGDFLPGYALRAYNAAEGTLSFQRADGKKKMTKFGRAQVANIKDQFNRNLNKLGIVWIDNNSDRSVWERIARFFNNETAPVLKKGSDRERWIDEK